MPDGTCGKVQRVGLIRFGMPIHIQTSVSTSIDKWKRFNVKSGNQGNPRHAAGWVFFFYANCRLFGITEFPCEQGLNTVELA
jgi:hypothetical protein